MLLNQGPNALTLDLTQGTPLSPLALLAGRNRALSELSKAASIVNVSYDPATGATSFRIQNQTGHKLISGYPEGRRMFVNVRVMKGGSTLFEVNPYDATSGTLKGLPPSYSANSPPLGPDESHVDDLVYEAHSTSSHTKEDISFHFALATGMWKDNRIPPKGFRIAEAAQRQAVPMAGGMAAPGRFTASEYAGGYDDVSLSLAPGGDAVLVELYYQTVSREYVEFLEGDPRSR